MGTSTSAANCTNVAQVGDHKWFKDLMEDLDPGLVVNGWAFQDESTYRGKSLYPSEFRGPNGERIYFLNSHQYAAGGARWWVVFGPKREYVEAFLKAQGIQGITIQAKAIVKQTC